MIFNVYYDDELVGFIHSSDYEDANQQAVDKLRVELREKEEKENG